MKQLKLPGFTLLEVAIVLLIIGIIGAGVFKGQDLIEGARIRSVAQDFERYRLALIHYQEAYQALPGDDAQATQRFGSGIAQGNGNQVIDANEASLAWVHLHKGGFVNTSTPPSGRMSGVYRFVHQPISSMSGHWLELGDGHGRGVLTPKQAQSLKAKIDEGQSKPDEGTLRIINDSSGSYCITDGNLNLNNNAKICLIYYQVS